MSIPVLSSSRKRFSGKNDVILCAQILCMDFKFGFIILLHLCAMIKVIFGFYIFLADI